MAQSREMQVLNPESGRFVFQYILESATPLPARDGHSPGFSE